MAGAKGGGGHWRPRTVQDLRAAIRFRKEELAALRGEKRDEIAEIKARYVLLDTAIADQIARFRHQLSKRTKAR